MSVKSKRTYLFEVVHLGLISDKDRAGHDFADGARKLVVLSHGAPPAVLAATSGSSDPLDELPSLPKRGNPEGVDDESQQRRRILKFTTTLQYCFLIC